MVMWRAKAHLQHNRVMTGSDQEGPLPGNAAYDRRPGAPGGQTRGGPDPTGRYAAALRHAGLGGFLIMIPGVLGYLSGNLWLFPSLGPSFFMQMETPRTKAARPYNVIAGHLIGIVAGYVSVIAVSGIAGLPSAFGPPHLLLSAHIAASGLSMGLMVLIQVLMKAQHPPASATTLLITLGEFRVAWSDISILLIGIAIMAVVGEIVRRALLIRSKRTHGDEEHG